jgi:predicted nucleotidyltransferase
MSIAALRHEKGLSQKDVARLMGLSLRTYQNYESGRSHETSFTGKAILRFLKDYEPYGEDKGLWPLEDLKKVIAGLTDPTKVDYVVLFGSYAKGTATEKSDVDLLVSTSLDGLDFFHFRSELKSALHKKVDLLRFQDLKNNQELLNEILKTGVRIYG